MTNTQAIISPPSSPASNSGGGPLTGEEGIFSGPGPWWVEDLPEDRVCQLLEIIESRYERSVSTDEQFSREEIKLLWDATTHIKDVYAWTDDLDVADAIELIHADIVAKHSPETLRTYGADGYTSIRPIGWRDPAVVAAEDAAESARDLEALEDIEPVVRRRVAMTGPLAHGQVKDALTAQIKKSGKAHKLGPDALQRERLAKELVRGQVKPDEHRPAAELLIDVANGADDVVLASFIAGEVKLIEWARGRVDFYDPAKDPAPEDPAIAKLNRRYAWVEFKDRVIFLDENSASNTDEIRHPYRYLHRNTFATTWDNQEINGEPAGAAWLKHPKRRTYRDAGLYPPPLVAGDKVMNLWRGFAVEPREGQWPLLRAHLRDVVCNGEEIADDYVYKWMAWSVQNPGKPAETAIAMRGGKGCGKGTLGRATCKIFGQHAAHISDGNSLTGRFNAHIANAVFVFSDEAFWSGNVAHESILKAIITETTRMVEPKGIDQYATHNMLHLMMATNGEWVVPAGLKDERRYVVLDVPDTRTGDVAYFEALNREMDRGGLAAMLHELLRVDLGSWHPRQIPKELLDSTAMNAQREASLPIAERWLLDILETGELPGDRFAMSATPKGWASSKVLEEACKEAHKGYRVPQAGAFGKLMKSAGAKSLRPSRRDRGWQFPPLAEARKEWCRTHYEREWLDVDGDDWSE